MSILFNLRFVLSLRSVSAQFQVSFSSVPAQFQLNLRPVSGQSQVSLRSVSVQLSFNLANFHRKSLVWILFTTILSPYRAQFQLFFLNTICRTTLGKKNCNFVINCVVWQKLNKVLEAEDLLGDWPLFVMQRHFRPSFLSLEWLL